MAEKQDATADSGLRADPRYPAEAISSITSMRLSPGEAVRLVNLSSSGVLVEGKTRFVPGTRVSVIFDGAKAPPTVKARVVRCQVSAIGGGGSLQYQSAIQFEQKIEVPVDEAALPPAPLAAAPEPTGSKKKQQEPQAPPKPHNRW